MDQKVIEMNTMLVKFLLNHGLDFSAAESVHLKKFCECLLESDSILQCPILSADELKTRILPNIYKSIVSKNQKNKFNKIIFVEKNEEFCLSFMCVETEDKTDESGYVYISSKKIEDNLLFKDLCADSIGKAYKL